MPDTRTFIFGSCVTRDTFEYLRPHNFSLVRYVARQSLITAANPPSTHPVPLERLSSRFQRRITQGALEGNLYSQLDESVIDLVLWDLADERTGVFQMPDGSYITRSVELDAAGLTTYIERAGGQHIPFGSDEHVVLWCSALRAFVRELAERGLHTKTQIVAPPWARRDTRGNRTSDSYGISASRANELTALYLNAAADLGFPIITVQEPLSDAAHQWGPAPFHYASNVYEELAAKILAARPNASERKRTTGRRLTRILDQEIVWELRNARSDLPIVIAVENLSQEELRANKPWLRDGLDHLGCQLLFVNDPTLTTAGSLRLGWGIGSRMASGIDTLLETVASITQTPAARRIYLGAGPSGFVAAQMALRDEAAAVILSNPDLGWVYRDDARKILIDRVGAPNHHTADYLDLRKAPRPARPPRTTVYLNEHHPLHKNHLQMLDDLRDAEVSPFGDRIGPPIRYRDRERPYGHAPDDVVAASIAVELDHLLFRSRG